MYMEGEMVMEMASVKLRRKVMASSSRLLVWWKRERLEGIKAWWKLDTRRYRSRQFYRFEPQN